MSFLKTLKQSLGAKDNKGIGRKWVIYYDKKDNIAEVKSLFQPESYKGSRPTYTDKQLLNKLENIKKTI